MRSPPLVSALVLALSACHDPASATHVARGNILRNGGDKLAAVAEYEKAAAADPKSALPRLLLGDVLVDLGRLDEAGQAYRAAAEAQPGTVDALIGLANVLSRQGKDEEALGQLDLALKESDGNLYARLSRATINLKLGRAEAAVKDAALAVQLKDRDPVALYTYGSALLATKDLVAARQTYQRLSELQPRSPLGPYGRARVDATEGKRAEALTELRLALSKGPLDPVELAKDPALASLKDELPAILPRP